MNVTYSTNKINGCITIKSKTFPIINITYYDSSAIKISETAQPTIPTGFDGINIRHRGPPAIKYLLNIYNAALNVNTISHLGKHATIISISKPKKDHSIGTYYQIQITFTTHCQNTRAGFPKFFGPWTLICDSFFDSPQSYVTSIFAQPMSNFILKIWCSLKKINRKVIA